MPVKIKMVGSKELKKQLRDAAKRNPKETVRALNECLLDLADASVAEAPIESGDLKNNCTAELNGTVVFVNQAAAGTPMPSNVASGRVGYSLVYAMRQHEDLTMRHDRTDGYKRKDGTSVNLIPGGKAKYLEDPFNARQDAYIKRLEQIPEDVIK